MIALFLRSYQLLCPVLAMAAHKTESFQGHPFTWVFWGWACLFHFSSFFFPHPIRVHYNAFQQLSTMVTWWIYVISWQMANTRTICLVSGTLPSSLHLEPFGLCWCKADRAHLSSGAAIFTSRYLQSNLALPFSLSTFVPRCHSPSFNSKPNRKDWAIQLLS